MSVYDEAHRQNILRQRESPHHSSGRTIRTWFYGPAGSRRVKSYDSPLGNEAQRLELWAWKIREKEESLLQKEGFAQDFLLIQLQEEKILWEKIHEIFKKHGSAP